jgi:hypothetical protein
LRIQKKITAVKTPFPTISKDMVVDSGHAVAYLFDAVWYKLEGGGFEVIGFFN